MKKLLKPLISKQLMWLYVHREFAKLFRKRLIIKETLMFEIVDI